MLSGKVEIRLKRTEVIAVNAGDKVVGELNSGDSFGELALQNDKPRGASIVAMMPSFIIVLSKKTYLNAMSNLKEALSETINFLKDIKQFQHMKNKNLTMIAAATQLRKLPVNTLILRQDDLPKSIYFIKQGLVKLLRKVDFRIPINKQ